MGDLISGAGLEEKVALALRLKGPMFAALRPEAGARDVKAVTAGALEIGAKLKPRVMDTTRLLHEMLGAGKRVLFEGANGSLLDVDHGTYPFVTSSSCCVGGIAPGTGVPPTKVTRVLGVMKAYSTRVGAGPMPTELKDAIGDRIRERGREFGTTTGRPRRVGWLDLTAVRYSAAVNGATGVCLTLLDVLSGVSELMVCTRYRVRGEETTWFPADGAVLAQAEPVYERMEGFVEEIGGVRKAADLPTAARRLIAFIEETVGVPVVMVGVGPDRAQTIEM
jgi:adenylosuccinate synthase